MSMPPLRMCLWPSVIVLLAGVAAAAGATSSSAPPPSFSRAVQPIFTDNCVACHQAGDAQQGLVLEEGEAFGHLVGRKSKEASMALVTPGHPDQSYLLRKLEGTHVQAGGAGVRMPIGSSLGPREIDTIRRWITSGANND